MRGEGHPPPASPPNGGRKEEGGNVCSGGERSDGHSKKTQETLYGYRVAFVEASQRQTDRRFQVSSPTTSMLIADSPVLGHFIAVTNIPQKTADWIVALPVSRYLIMIFICIIYEIGGSFIDDLTFMILATPIFYPAALKLGFPPLWFGIVIAVVEMIGVVIPPVAICVFVVKNITKVPIGLIYKGVAPFLISLILVWGLLFFFPQLALWLPSVLYK